MLDSLFFPSKNERDVLFYRSTIDLALSHLHEKRVRLRYRNIRYNDDVILLIIDILKLPYGISMNDLSSSETVEMFARLFGRQVEWMEDLKAYVIYRGYPIFGRK